MFLTMHKEYAIKIQKQKIVTLADFFKQLPDIKPFNETINGIKYPNAFLIKDFQVAIEEFRAFIYVVETLKNKELISLYFIPKLRNSINIIQKSHLSQRYEKSAPFYPTIWEYETKEIRIRDKKFLKKFIKTMLSEDNESHTSKTVVKIACWTLLFTVIGAGIAGYAVFCNKKPQQVIIVNPNPSSDSSKTKTLKESLNNKADSLGIAKLPKDTLNTTKQ
jgi:hypothetical protein